MFVTGLSLPRKVTASRFQLGITMCFGTVAEEADSCEKACSVHAYGVALCQARSEPSWGCSALRRNTGATCAA